ncbi:sigma-54 dependent dna-binding response regulator [hydrocarbon metagenome]|uniref:Sigma-54 dependent dna-binding response regulator n=1 Tax=hydrocarbon metagenome TaxID=938273 RepID=A0A0W8G4X2_9ZZZZ
MARVLVVDDDPIFQTQMGIILNRLGHQAMAAKNMAEGLALAEKQVADVVFLDVYLPDAFGLDGIGRFRSLATEPEVIVVTAQGDPDSAERAIHNGAWYYLEKPVVLGTIRLTLERCLDSRDKLREAGQRLVLERDGIVGSSPALKQSLFLLGQAARGRENVCITGETGTGKELFARALHDNSPRRDRPFVVVDCTNIPSSLAESILFGHTRGAFTDARQDYDGLIALADGGTLFLDEVGDMPGELQRTLLRVIQEKRYRPLGAKRERTSDFRVVAVTNRDIRGMVKSGAFREDLYYRLAQRHLHLPPLRLRGDDVRLLAGHYVTRICSDQGMDVKGLSTEYLESLSSLDWPGNVRQLVSTIGVSIANAGDAPVLVPHHLPPDHKARYLRQRQRESLAARPGPPETGPADTHDVAPGLEDSPELPTLRQFRETAWERLEAAYVARLWTASGGRVAEAMRLAGISRARLYQLLKKFPRDAGPDRPVTD